MKALLDQLRESQAWQELLDDPNPPPPDANVTLQTMHSTHLPPLEHNPESEPEPEPVSNHITSLLSRLQPGGGEPSSLGKSHSRPSLSATHHAGSQGTAFMSSVRPRTPTVNGITAMPIGPSPPQASIPRPLNFNQSLPVIARLSEDPAFMEKLEKVSRFPWPSPRSNFK